MRRDRRAGRPRSQRSWLVHLDGLAAVLGEERLLEARLAGLEVDEPGRGGGLDDGRHRAGHAHPQAAVDRRPRLAHARGARRTPRPRPGAANRSSTSWWARSRRASTRSTVTRRPSRMIATRSQVFSTSPRMCDERNAVRPSRDGLAEELEERLLDERVETGGRLVEDEQVGPVLERDDQAHLLLVALRVLLEAPRRIEVEAGDQVGLVERIDAAAEVGEVLDRLRRRSAGRTGRTRRAGSRSAGGWRPGRPSSRCRTRSARPRRRADEVEQEPDRGRLARRRSARGSRRSRPARPRGRRRRSRGGARRTW